MLQGARLQRDEGLSSPFLPSRFPSLVFLEDPLVQHGHFLTRLARPLPAPSVRPRGRRDKRGGQTHRISYKTSQIVDFPLKPLSAFCPWRVCGFSRLQPPSPGKVIKPSFLFIPKLRLRVLLRLPSIEVGFRGQEGLDV